MQERSKKDSANGKWSRRTFLGAGGAAMIGGSAAWAASQTDDLELEAAPEPAKVQHYRVLGRTGYKVSDICMGANRNRDAAVVRYAVDMGINYIDTAERYQNGESERIIGEALKEIDRKKLFITTKVHLGEKDDESSVLERFRKCLERLNTDYVDALFMHSVNSKETLDHEGFHAATQQLKKEGRLKHIGVSSHGSRNAEEPVMEQALCAAAEDGRFDLMLLVYNFLNKEAGEKVIAACKKNNVGAVAMKTSPGAIKVTPVDPENLTEDQVETLKWMKNYGLTEEQAIERMKQGMERQKEAVEKTKPFVEKHGIKTDEQLQSSSVQWVLNNPDIHSVCVSFGNFDILDRIVGVSGKKLSRADTRFLQDYERAFGDQYCRHGCTACAGHCPRNVPVSTIMRYAYYFDRQGREKHAMKAYSRLKERNAALCLDCHAPCTAGCPHKLNVRAHLMKAHSLLSLV